MKNLIGYTVNAVWINPDKTILAFEMNRDGGPLALYRTEGDCCSKSWIEHMENASTFKSVTVTDVEDIEMPEGTWTGSEEDRGELIQYYGVKIKGIKMGSGFTVDGIYRTFEVPAEMMIEYRNESNGYYGGSIEAVDKLLSISILEDLQGLKRIDADF